MKKFIILLFILLCFTLPLQGNPIMPAFFSEIYFDDNDDWSIELYDYYQMGFNTLDDCYFESTTNMAYFNNGIIFTPNDTLVVTNDDMQTDLIINRAGDFLVMGGNTYDEMRWGNYQYSNVNAPYPGQSLVRVKFYTSWYPSDEPGFYLAKENEPSLGYNPYNAQTFGSLMGQVTDGDGVPVENADITISPADYHNSTLYTDENGFFEVSCLYALNYNLSTTISGYPTIDTTITVEPDSTTYIHIFPIYDTDPTPQHNIYSISNYPNPFIESTTISFDLATKSHKNTQINIYNAKGQLIRKFLPVAHSPGHPVSVIWDGKNESNVLQPPGFYFYSLEVDGKKAKTNKMIMVR